MSVLTHSKRIRSHEPVSPDASKRPTGSRGFSRCTDPNVPEWKTDAWKRHVEAEARRHLKDKIQEIGARR